MRPFSATPPEDADEVEADLLQAPRKPDRVLPLEPVLA